MQELRDLILNLSLLFTLAVTYQIAVSRFPLGGRASRLLVGVVFGLVVIIGMTFPLTFIEGLIFDGRSVILSLAGLFGGPLVVGIAAAMAAIYRFWIGGPGMVVGILAILAASILGILAYFVRQRLGGRLKGWMLYSFGLLVQLVMLALFIQLPDGWHVVERIGPTLLITYPLATLFLGLLFQDYEAQARTRAHLNELAYYDALTGLPNRTLLLEYLDRVLREDKPEHRQHMLAIFNLDRFKTVNDARGHAMGDTLLKAVGSRLQSLSQPDDTVARIGSDEFALLLSRSHGEQSGMTEQVSRIARAMRHPLAVAGEEIDVGVSVGATEFAAGGAHNASEVLRRADTALHQAKRRGGNQSVFFDAAMSAEVERRFAIEHDLRRALSETQLCLFLQSQFTAKGQLVGAEVLVRWYHPERGLLTPCEFVPIAEESDLIVALGEWVFTHACELLTRPALRERAIDLAINISPKHFLQPHFVHWIDNHLREAGVDPRRIVLEITEGMLLDDHFEAAAKMQALADLGLRFSIDDFGTGYSSLAYLKRLPIDEIKIDQSFVRDVPTDPSDATLVETMLAIAERLSLKVVAEGIETEAQARFFDGRGEVFRQGYFYARPQAAEDWLRQFDG
ncbi:MAG: EAL domain-containing protein [Pseudomonadota bacterium]